MSLPHHHHLNSAGLDLFPSLLLSVQMNCSLSSNALVFPVTSCQHHNTQKSCFWKRKEKGIRNFESFCVCVWRWGIYTILLWFIFRIKIPFFFKSWQIYHKISNTLKFVLCNLQKLTFSHSRRRKWYSFVNGFKWWEHLACISHKIFKIRHCKYTHYQNIFTNIPVAF